MTWWPSTSPQGRAFNIDPHDSFNDVLQPDGRLHSFPQTRGPYAFTLGPGTTVQTTVAP